MRQSTVQQSCTLNVSDWLRYSTFVSQGNESISLDFATQVQRIAALGFNTIELPFSFKTLLEAPPAALQTQCTVTPYSQVKVSSG